MAKFIGIFRRNWTIQISLIIIFLVFVSVVFPVFPDELSRIRHAKALIDTGSYDFSWPPLTVVLAAISLFIVSDPMSVRLVQLVIALPLIYAVTRIEKDVWQFALLVILLPYFALVMATAVPQGLMVAVMGWLILRPEMHWCAKGLLIGLACSANPLLIVLIPTAYAVLATLGRCRWSDFGASLLGLLVLVPWIYWGWIQTGEFLFTLSTNGPVNLFYGNNPDVWSHRGVGDADALRKAWGMSPAAGYTDLVREYFYREPLSFLANILKKFVLYVSPADYVRAINLGSSEALVMIGIFTLSQLSLYTAVCIVLLRAGLTKPLAIALVLFVVGWILYTAFFFKIRFRIPFDLFLFLAILQTTGLSLRASLPTWLTSLGRSLTSHRGRQHGDFARRDKARLS